MPTPPEEARRRLEPIEHIVVLVLENRSFDHALGYLALPEHRLEDRGELPVDLDGLDLDAFSNQHDGVTYKPEPLDESVFHTKDLDPPHSADGTAAQIDGGSMGGFVSAFAGALAAKNAEGASDPEVLKAVMGYLTPAQVPVYDHLARNFCVCDRWHCSVAGPTMPNRFYAVAGTTNGVVGNIDVIVGEFGKFKSFFRYLERDAWRWYSSDPGILRAIDEKYSFDNDLDRFAYFDQRTEVQKRSFLSDVLEGGGLPAVSWIDPNFAMGKMIPDIPFFFDGPGSNDDHPPVPVMAGQKLVNKIYTALGRSPYWDSTLFVVMYDEHGGFYDHVPPPGKLGPRTPALLISPHVQRGVCHTLFDHASVIRTILVRFGGADALERMPESVRAAEDFSVAMREDGQRVPFTPVPSPGPAAIGDQDLVPEDLPASGSTIDRALNYADSELTDLQRDIVLAIAIPLRTGWKILRRVREHPFLKPLVRLLDLIPRRRLQPRRP